MKNSESRNCRSHNSDHTKPRMRSPPLLMLCFPLLANALLMPLSSHCYPVLLSQLDNITKYMYRLKAVKTEKREKQQALDSSDWYFHSPSDFCQHTLMVQRMLPGAGYPQRELSTITRYTNTTIIRFIIETTFPPSHCTNLCRYTTKCQLSIVHND